MNLKKSLLVMALGAFTFGLSPAFGAHEASAAGEDQLQIKDIVGKNTYLMSDGSMWTTVTLLEGTRTIHTKGNIETISGNLYDGLGITKDRRLVEWDMGLAPHPVEGTAGVKQVSGNYWLKSDGTVWSGQRKLKNLSGIVQIAYGEKDFAALSQNGDLLFEDPHKQDTYKKFGTVADPSSVKSMAVHDDRVALLFNSGEVVLYEGSNFDDNGKIIPVTVAQDAVHITYVSADPTDVLIVTRKDGTVWLTGEYSKRWKLTNQVQGLSDVVRTSVDAYADKLSEGIYAQRSDGTWVFSKDGEIKPIGVPAVTAISVTLSDKEPFVGDSVEVYIQETYSNGAKIKVPVREAKLDMDKPYLLKLQADGKLKTVGVGQTKLTVTSGGVSASVTVSASLRDPLKFAKQVNGTVFLPVKAVSKALGGTGAPSGDGWNVAFGDASLSFKAGSLSAQFAGKDVQLKAAPFTEKGETYIPASLLADTLGAKVSWDAKWKQADIGFGSAKMTVVSSETAGLIKKAMQGSLAKFIGKSYWVNDFADWERFSKVTVTDVLPTDTGSFDIVFKTPAGKTLKSYSMSSSEVIQVLTDSNNFLNYDPYKKYNWSSSVWKQIKARNVTLGMTKQQVLLSWGNPIAKDIQKVQGSTIETWGYASYDFVSFLNGKVTLIIM
ncbi:copper amine oxidase N-terminal domain-containing protein [Paenibacillus sp. VCA1]|uniref:copper amine oxidase N-terminal domain-containing protein n=1 Tax=Paenibacillus sp. VCA1 TaxID=3039148 RepID=UPI0028726868|nr:copper amine oxidase N-terminal domain-containing protein [Paenibacillus sp. VCA1]MDR9857001.1 copper amine oxidase N-terminal domain-containing protein [Paenibacillus sp. VCA1]